MFNPVVDTPNMVVDMLGIDKDGIIKGQVKISGKPVKLYAVTMEAKQ